MQLNFTHLPKTGQYSKHMVASQRACYNLLSESSMYLIPFVNSLKYRHTLRNRLIFRFYVAILVSAKSAITPDFRLDVKRRLVLMKEQTVGAIVENHDVAMLAGHNAMHYSDSLKEDYLHKLFESHSKVFQTVILIFLVLFEHDFLRNL